jgi:hypothetical protein
MSELELEIITTSLLLAAFCVYHVVRGVKRK